MSEGDVSLIRDEDVLRRMWQQTEDFSRKKEIRAHMYRLREERLRNLHSPEPSPLPKGVAPAMHVASFADQSFQGLKSKEVRDAGSPPKEFRADLKELSNAGWNVESENKTTDDGHTQIRGVHASVKGHFDVAGGQGQFAAVDSHRQAETVHHDDTTSLHRREAASNTAAHEEVVRRCDDGTHTSSTASSSSATSKFQQISSTTHEVPYSTDDYDQSRRETSNRNEYRQVTNTNDYEQNVSKNELDNGELISRKVDYPDSNTKIIVETRCLPDGSRVTSTQREFRAPTQSARSEQHSTRSETKSYFGSSRHTSDRRESSKVTQKYDNYDIVDSQRKADDYDFKRIQVDNTKNDYSQSQNVTQTTESKRFDTRESSSNVTRETIDNRNVDIEAINKNNINIEQNENSKRNDFSESQRTNQYYNIDVNETSQRQKMTKNDTKMDEQVYSMDNNIRNTHTTSSDTKSENIDCSEMTAEVNKYTQREINDINYNKRRDEKTGIHDQKVDDIVKKQTSDQYQTTYQTDYTQKKISNDWSPTHQAWASTLRADSPSTTRPIRAQSPGSRTYQSNTAFQRNSVSPDKACKKPSSRSGSPNKIDHSSPSRILNDRFSTISSNQSVSEATAYRYTSPERKSPRSPNRSNIDKKTDNYRQRASQSPDNYPYEHKPRTSPDKKLGSPGGDVRAKSPSRTSEGTPRPSPSPERKVFSGSPPMPSSYRSTNPVEQVNDRETSPDKKSGPQKYSQIPTSGYTPNHPNLSATRPSVSPDRKPGYMRSTATSKAPGSPANASSDRKSPTKHTLPSQSPERKYKGETTPTDDHYTFIDEETKMYTRSKDTTDFCRPESPSLRPSIRKASRSPSPPKGPVTFTDDQTTKTENIVTNIDTKFNRTDYTKINRFTKPDDSPVRDLPREVSPPKYGTYDKKRRSGEITSIATENKYDYLTRRQKTTKTETSSPSSPPKNSPRNSVSPVKSYDSPGQPSHSKYDTYDKKDRTKQSEHVTVNNNDTKDEYDHLTRRQASTKQTPEVPTSSTKKTPRESVSPVKSPTKYAKYKYSTDFIATEIAREETNKSTKPNRPRQLVTPSTSPTRKHKDDETAPSTGQSSPTTSVSGFIYFSSPKTDTTLVTDLDDTECQMTTQKSEEINITTQIQRPDTLKIERSPSPSKMPCRSPSPEKKMTPTKEALPRKSSLKKPSSGSNLQSPVEKPPSSFRVSPTDESYYVPEHKIVKKDRPNEAVDTPAKTKHPFERRETYEERCLKILGVVDDITKTDSKEIECNHESPDQLPRPSLEPKDNTILTSHVTQKEAMKVNVADFINHEKSKIATNSTSTLREDIYRDRKSKTPSRDSSPTKLQDIISHNNIISYDKKTDSESQGKNKICESPDRDIGYEKHDTLRRSLSPKKKTPESPKNLKPTGMFQNLDQNVFQDKLPKKSSPSRSSVSPDRKPSYMKATTASSTKFESTDKQEGVTTKITRSSLDRETGYQNTKDHPSPRPENQRSSSPSKNKDETFPKVHISPERKYSARDSPEKTPENKTPSRIAMSPDRKLGDIKHTASSITKYEEMYSMETKSADSTLKVDEKIRNSVALSTKKTDHPGKKSEASKNSRTPSPNKKITKSVEEITQFIQSEREQEILDKVQRSLRKLSPNRDQQSPTRDQQSPTRNQQSPSRNQQSPTREKSPGKTKISLEDLDVNCTTAEKSIIEQKKQNLTKNDEITTHTTKVHIGKPQDQKPISKIATRTVSPAKKPTASSSTKPEKSFTSRNPENPNMSRSISPKKPVSPTGGSQSPQVSKPSSIKPRDPTPTSFTRKPSSGNMSPTKTEKITTDLKKVTKQNSFTSMTNSTTSKNSASHKVESEPKCSPASKGINKENVSPKKEDIKVIRAASDISLKTKKASPQKVKSKPEIQVNDVSSSKYSKSTITSTINTTTTSKKSSVKQPQVKLAPKPKSATALNTSTDEDDIIIDVEQAKSSRENSPDRICPTPIDFIEDVGTPRFPDEVSEPDDEFRKRTHHTIHETESIVDDIVEICEDDELFVKCSDVDRIADSEDRLLSVTDKVSKFTNKIGSIPKSKESTAQLKNVESLVHSDFVDENLKSDECLLSVTEKVHRFATGPRDTKDHSPARKITDEYDTETIYQDDYTKLSVNDKAHLFVETAENVNAPKLKPAQKAKRPDISNVDESLKSDDCLLSVSAKVNKFVKSAEQFLNETTESKEKDQKIKEEYEKIMKHITNEEEDAHTTKIIQTEKSNVEDKKFSEDKTPSFARETTSSHTKIKDYPNPNLKTSEKNPLVKITLRSSEAVKKAKALFENIASSQKTTDIKTTKLTDIGINKSPKTDSTTALHPSIEASPNVTDIDSEVDTPHTPSYSERVPPGSHNRPHQPNRFDDNVRGTTNRQSSQSPEIPRGKSPVHRTSESKTVLSRYSIGQNESTKHIRPDVVKQHNHPEAEKSKVPSYQRPTKTSQVKEVNVVEETEVSSRRGSGKFGVELRRTSVEKVTMSAERRRSSTEHPCIEDIFDLDLLEQMLEKVVGYEQRRRIRAQIRIAKKNIENEKFDTYTKTKSSVITKIRSPDRKTQNKSPERQKPSLQRTLSPERLHKSTPVRIVSNEHTQIKDETRQLLNGHTKESNTIFVKRCRPQSPEKSKSTPKTKSPTRQPSPDKKARSSPNKSTGKPKPNRFSEYASAYMKKVGLTETEKLKFADKSKKSDLLDSSKAKTTETKDYVSSDHVEEHKALETKTMSMSKSYSERTSSKDRIEIVQMNGKRSQSPEKKRPSQYSPSERLYQRSPSPDFKRTKSDKAESVTRTVYNKEPHKSTKLETVIKSVSDGSKTETNKKETIVKTVNNIEKKTPGKQIQDEKPSWMTNRNLKKISSETRTFGSKKVEAEKLKYRAASPTKVLARTAPTPTDVITSSYGPGPLDADGRPLFGIKALRNGASNYQVKGTVVRSEYHSRNGGEPEGSMSVTAYSTKPEDLERLLQAQSDRPSRIHGLAAITTTKKFGGDSGTTLREVRTKEERAALDHFTHSDRKVTDRIDVETFDKERTPERTIEMRDDVKGAGKAREDRRGDRKTVRQSSVRSLTEKYIKSASDTSRNERSAYPKAGLILRTATMKDSLSSDSSAHAGLGRTDSEHSLGSTEETTSVTRTTQLGDPQTTTTTTSRHQSHQQQSDHQTTTTTSSSRHHVQQQYTPAQRAERSFLDSSTKVTGVQDILTRMKNADIVINEGDSCEDAEARALLNKFLGATVLMAGMQGYVTEKPSGKLLIKQETVRSSSSGGTKTTTTTTSTKRIEDIDLDHCWDEQVLRKLLEESTDYEQRRRLRARIRTLMAEQEACASAVTAALGAADDTTADTGDVDSRVEEEVTVTSSVRRNSSEKTVSSSTSTKTSKVIESMTRGAPKPVSPFAKFRQLEKQNSTNTPNSPKSPQSPGSPAKAPYFKFTDPALQASALTIKERLLQWCRDKTRDYENVKLENFSTSWADGLAFCALVHHFLPDAFDYSKLTPDKRRHNFTLAFKIADEKAGIYPLLDVDDMVAMRKPDWKCVFTYVQAIHRHFKDQP